MRRVLPRERLGDGVLIGITLALVLIGFAMLASASAADAYEHFEGDSYGFLRNQALALAIGIVAFYVCAKINYRLYRGYAVIFFLISLALLAGVLVFGKELNYVKGWFQIGSYTFQPVEFVKILFPLFLATWFGDKSALDLQHIRKGLFPFLLITGIPVLLILFQPDFGSAVIIAFIACVMFFAAGASKKEIVIIIIIAVFAFWTMITVDPERAERIISFLNPEEDIAGANYQVDQALTAIGSGGLSGKGFGKSVQKFKYLPEVSSDSIFAIIAEELGFISVIIPILFFGLFVRGLRIANQSPDFYGKILAIGLCAWVAGQAFINLGGIVQVIPLTGLPLPFVSHGGSALIAALAGIGILYNISKEGHYG